MVILEMTKPAWWRALGADMRIWLAAAVGALASVANAADIDIQIDNFTSDGNIARVVMKVKNTSTKPYSNIFIDCTFLDANKKAIDIGKALISGIDANSYAYDKASIVATGREEYVECSVSKASN